LKNSLLLKQTKIAEKLIFPVSKKTGLPTLDIELLKRCILSGETNLAEAVKVFQQGISTICE
jgi:hypothetical protein